MSKKESRRIVPLSAVALTAFAILVLFEVLVIGGAYKIKASRVARIAPWAYEPFLKLVGEHPESETLKDSVGEQPVPVTDALSGMASVAGLTSDGLVIDTDAQQKADGEGAADTERPAEILTNAVPAGSSVTNPVPARSGEVVPVG